MNANDREMASILDFIQSLADGTDDLEKEYIPKKKKKKKTKTYKYLQRIGVKVK